MTPASTPRAGPRFSQIVEISVDSGRTAYGSGYQIGPGLVLTARHVIAQPGVVEVRFPFVEPKHILGATVLWTGDRDLALLELITPIRVQADGHVSIGFVRRSNPIEIPFIAIGFPHDRASETETATIRDTLQIRGEIALGSNVKKDVLELSRNGKPILDRGSSWMGMSGAAIFSHGLLIGVVRYSESDGRLYGEPLVSSSDPFATAGLSDERVSESLSKHLFNNGVPTTAIPTRRQPSYSADVARLSAQHRELIGRRREISLVWSASRFTFYSWWTAPPWAGKTALALHLAMNPPPDTDIIAFFFSRADAQQAPEFWDAVTDQLAALLDEETPSRSRAAFNSLWQRACRQAAAQSRRVLLLIDGLDENDYPFVAPHLPMQQFDAGSVVMLGRSHPGLPGELPAAHPLLDPAGHIRFTLAPSRRGHAVEERAIHDLERIVYGEDGLAIKILGLLATAGPMAETEIRAVLRVAGDNVHMHDTKKVLEFGPVARVVVCRRGSASGRYSIAHEHLCQYIRAELADVDWTAPVVNWAASYADDGWPDSTPDYLLSGYTNFLIRMRGPDATSELFADARISLLDRRAKNNQYLAGRELATLLEISTARADPNLSEICRIAFALHQYLEAHQVYPVGCAEVAARCGDVDLAMSIADGQRTPREKAEAFLAVATVATELSWGLTAEFALALGKSALARLPVSEQLMLLPMSYTAESDNAGTARLERAALTDTDWLADDRQRYDLLLATAYYCAVSGDSRLGWTCLSEAAALHQHLPMADQFERQVAFLAAANANYDVLAESTGPAPVSATVRRWLSVYAGSSTVAAAAAYLILGIGAGDLGDPVALEFCARDVTATMSSVPEPSVDHRLLISSAELLLARDQQVSGLFTEALRTSLRDSAMATSLSALHAYRKVGDFLHSRQIVSSSLARLYSIFSGIGSPIRRGVALLEIAGNAVSTQDLDLANVFLADAMKAFSDDRVSASKSSDFHVDGPWQVFTNAVLEHDVVDTWLRHLARSNSDIMSALTVTMLSAARLGSWSSVADLSAIIADPSARLERMRPLFAEAAGQASGDSLRVVIDAVAAVDGRDLARYSDDAGLIACLVRGVRPDLVRRLAEAAIQEDQYSSNVYAEAALDALRSGSTELVDEFFEQAKAQAYGGSRKALFALGRLFVVDSRPEFEEPFQRYTRSLTSASFQETAAAWTELAELAAGSSAREISWAYCWAKAHSASTFLQTGRDRVSLLCRGARLFADARSSLDHVTLDQLALDLVTDAMRDSGSTRSPAERSECFSSTASIAAYIGAVDVEAQAWHSAMAAISTRGASGTQREAGLRQIVVAMVAADRAEMLSAVDSLDLSSADLGHAAVGAITHGLLMGVHRSTEWPTTMLAREFRRELRPDLFLLASAFERSAVEQVFASTWI